MASSIRGTLLGWYGAIVFVVVVGFGASLYARASTTMLESIDASIASRADTFAGALAWDEEDGWELELSSDYVAALADNFRFGVWTPGGESVRHHGMEHRDVRDLVTGFAKREDWRELVARDSRGVVVIVASSLEEYEVHRRRLLWGIVGAGLGALAVALLGGWWLANRTLGPIVRMTETAAGISERDLAGRVDPKSIPGELRGLATTLNDTFGRLEAAFARQKRFTADASHELRTPLAVIRTQIDVALSRERTPDAYRAALRACLRAVSRMSDVVDGLLYLARTDGDERVSERAPLDLGKVALDAVELLRPEVERRQLTLSHDLRSTIVLGDADRLGVAVSNLVNNAIDYNRPGGEIEIRVSESAGRALLTVRDTGIGIPPGVQPRVFDRFYRVDAARSRDRGGSGLGLAIVHSIVLAHGGTVSVRSVEGQGTTFTVVLPAVAPG